jgi:hypothetical protein
MVYVEPGEEWLEKDESFRVKGRGTLKGTTFLVPQKGVF